MAGAGDRGGAPHAAIEQALWDLAGRALGQPVYRLLGGYRERIDAYASTPVLADIKSIYNRHEATAAGFSVFRF